MILMPLISLAILFVGVVYTQLQKMAVSFKRLPQDEDDLEDDDVEQKRQEDSVRIVLEEKHPETGKAFTVRRRLTCPSRPCGSWGRSRINSWSVVFAAVTVFTVAVILSLFLSLFLTEPAETTTAPTPFNSSAGAVATDSLICSEMGGHIFDIGGSAVDAAIVAMLCIGTVHPESSGIGGGGFMTIFDPSNQTVKAINFREAAPAAATYDMFHGQANLSLIGGLAVGVPGELAGMKLAHDLYGRLPWADLFKPVIKLARDGYPLSEHSAKAIGYVHGWLGENPRFRDWYYHNGTLKSPGDLVQRPKFADALQEIATHGPEAFYNGTLAEDIVREVQDNGGILSLEDLQSYEALLKDPVHVKYADFDFYAPPLPSGGPQMLFILNVMENMNLGPGSQWRNLTYQHLVESFKYSFALRSHIGDPDCDECDREAVLNIQNQYLLSEKYAALVNDSISNSRTFPPNHYNGSYFTNDSGTTHLSVVGTDGMAVSMTSTVNGYFGSLLITPSGIVLNNEMDDFSSPNVTNLFGLLPYEANFVRPGKRPLSSTCPSIMLKRNQEGQLYSYLAVGASGGTHIITATAQVALRVIAFRQNVMEAIEAKRLHNQLYPNVVYAEANYPANITAYLRSLGHNVTIPDPYRAIVQAVAQETEGLLTAHSDSREGKYSGSFVYQT